jgi:hypothetical protein
MGDSNKILIKKIAAAIEDGGGKEIFQDYHWMQGIARYVVCSNYRPPV